MLEFFMCPHCKKQQTQFKIVGTSGQTSVIGSPKIPMVAYCCPSCSMTISAEIDPVHARNQLIRALRKG